MFLSATYTGQVFLGFFTTELITHRAIRIIFDTEMLDLAVEYFGQELEALLHHNLLCWYVAIKICGVKFRCISHY